MKLKKVTVPAIRSGKNELRVNRAGQWSFTRQAIRELNLTKDMCVTVYMDESSPRDWYFEVGQSGEFRLRQNEKTGMMFFGSAGLKKKILDALNLEYDERYVFGIGEPVTYEQMVVIPIITARYKDTNNKSYGGKY